MKYVSGRIVCGIYIWLGLERGSGRANRKKVCSCGAVSGQRVVEGEDVYKYGAVGNYCCVFRNVGN